ncbi:YsnF/AvaK domain-containing protein [Thermobifida cellulosilytica]|uniref:Photosystem reaction center subunit H n=1 Tax=Thermobifida cellulosilytica TB100 TaxID=665004 RepID=A0A147KL91_THECS|nr:YsnF/AvaK domain-containing protein [Thermobifida cellulosilytica]KUP98072.1 hypothetical protein AC529_03725 [Thermobifida cellulosilytica TB100]
MAPRLGIQELIGHKLIDQDGHSVGRIGQVYRDDQTHQPTWVTVQTGMFGSQESFVPLAGAEITDEDLRVPFSKSLIKDSPRFEAGGHLSPEQEAQLYRHYGVQPKVPGPRGQAEEVSAEERARREERTRREERGAGERSPEEASGRGGEAFMTRSEEQARIGVERTESGRARIHKTVESEPFEQDVSVRREELRIEREPVTGEEPTSGRSRMGEQEEEIVLHEEHAVVGKEEVPVERVRISKEEVTDTERVTGELRKEHIEIDEEDKRSGRRRER